MKEVCEIKQKVIIAESYNDAQRIYKSNYAFNSTIVTLRNNEEIILEGEECMVENYCVVLTKDEDYEDLLVRILYKDVNDK